MRVLRLVLGIYIMVQGFQDRIWMFVILGGLFVLLAVLNAGCCATGGCATPARKATDSTEDVKFKEIK